eukprot:6323759-Pyramimonas_sp.AAC.1
MGSKRDPLMKPGGPKPTWRLEWPRKLRRKWIEEDGSVPWHVPRLAPLLCPPEAPDPPPGRAGVEGP